MDLRPADRTRLVLGHHGTHLRGVGHAIVHRAFLFRLGSNPVHRLNHLLVGRFLQRTVVNAVLHTAERNHDIALRGQLVEHPFVG